MKKLLFATALLAGLMSSNANADLQALPGGGFVFTQPSHSGRSAMSSDELQYTRKLDIQRALKNAKSDCITFVYQNFADAKIRLLLGSDTDPEVIKNLKSFTDLKQLEAAIPQCIKDRQKELLEDME